ncbi:MAG: hypothetical protein AAGD40_10840 [Pseudomonadota bacterium]
MSADAHLGYKDLMRQREATKPAPIGAVDRNVSVGHNRPPSGVPMGILTVYVGAFAVLLLALSIPAMGAAPMPLIFAICVICFGAYFGGGLLSPIGRESRERIRHAMVATESGPLTAREAAWQILPLPILLASFGVFAMVLKAAMF